ncbi:MAG: hypothetical protein KF830_14455 [Planctomycetes bacterium]|nr:hypothetical protein [Planctomycetota bacterium]
MWPRRVAIAAGAIVLALLVGELTLRVAGWFLDRTRTLTADAELGWRMLPGVRKWGDGWSAARPGTTNSLGWRDDEFLPERAAGRRRLLALGDSFVFGFGVDQGERFTELLEDDRVEVVNLGVCAWGTDQQVLLSERELPRLRPDVVLWVVCVANDLDDIRSERKAGWAKPWFTLDGDRLQLHPPQADWRLGLRTSTHLGELMGRVLDAGRPAQSFASAWRDRDPTPLFRALARRLAAGVEAAGARLLALVEHPPSPAPEPAGPLATAVLQALDEAGVASLDLLPVFTAERRHWPHQRLPCGHWSAAGHRIVADAVRQELERRGWW